MIFKQLFEPDSCTYSYLLGCPETRLAVIIDPVIDTAERDVQVLKALGLTLAYTLETHVHADHLTGAHKLRQYTQCKVAYPALDNLGCADIGVEEGVPLRVGSLEIHPLFTPGHTDTHHCYRVDNGSQMMVFSGDALLIDACGRTDFQSGNAGALYHSIHSKLFCLPDETLVYPGHDYEGRFISCIAQEKKRNPRLGGGKSEQDFVALMNHLNLPVPRKIHFAVPGNQQCGQCPDNVPEDQRAPCEMHEQG